jgi:hypothetical protein
MNRELRVVYENRPYLVFTTEDGSLDHAHGPFTPGTEPSLHDCTDGNQVRERSMLDTLATLMPLSPTLRLAQDSLAENE